MAKLVCALNRRAPQEMATLTKPAPCHCLTGETLCFLSVCRVFKAGSRSRDHFARWLPEMLQSGATVRAKSCHFQSCPSTASVFDCESAVFAASSQMFGNSSQMLIFVSCWWKLTFMSCMISFSWPIHELFLVVPLELLLYWPQSYCFFNSFMLSWADDNKAK